jgi:hypothetical protein
MRAAVLLLAAALVPAHALAQAPRQPAAVGAAERNAVELKRGMTPEEVQTLLGKPRRTALRADPGYAGASPQGTLQWTYIWGSSNASSPERTLQVDFAGKGAGEWAVNGWAWPGL